MSEEKLDLILTVVSDIRNRVDKIESRMDNLDSRMDNLESEFKDFKKQGIELLTKLNNRIDILEKQLFAVGVELKEEIRREVKEVRDEIARLENTIMLEQAEKLQDRVRVRQLEMRVAKLEEKLIIAA